jgi:putative NIF3 family GTP cyclohydrolase 1 type 2
MKALEVKEFLEKSAGSLGSEEGFRFRNPDVEVRGILVSRMTTLKAIEKAVEDCNLMVVHEDLFYPYSFQRDTEFESYLTWSVNRRRFKMLSEHDITVFRAHGTLDRMCILDCFAEALELPEPSVRHGYVRITM